MTCRTYASVVRWTWFAVFLPISAFLILIGIIWTYINKLQPEIKAREPFLMICIQVFCLTRVICLSVAAETRDANSGHERHYKGNENLFWGASISLWAICFAYGQQIYLLYCKAYRTVYHSKHDQFSTKDILTGELSCREQYLPPIPVVPSVTPPPPDGYYRSIDENKPLQLRQSDASVENRPLPTLSPDAHSLSQPRQPSIDENKPLQTRLSTEARPQLSTRQPSILENKPLDTVNLDVRTQALSLPLPGMSVPKLMDDNSNTSSYAMHNSGGNPSLAAAKQPFLIRNYNLLTNRVYTALLSIVLWVAITIGYAWVWFDSNLSIHYLVRFEIGINSAFVLLFIALAVLLNRTPIKDAFHVGRELTVVMIMGGLSFLFFYTFLLLFHKTIPAYFIADLFSGICTVSLSLIYVIHARKTMLPTAPQWNKAATLNIQSKSAPKRRTTPVTEDARNIATLTNCINNSTGYRCFRQYMVSEYAYENLSFFTAVVLFHRIAGAKPPPETEEDAKYLSTSRHKSLWSVLILHIATPPVDAAIYAREIYATNIANDSMFPINISHGRRQKIKDFFERNQSKSASPTKSNSSKPTLRFSLSSIASSIAKVVSDRNLQRTTQPNPEYNDVLLDKQQNNESTAVYRSGYDNELITIFDQAWEEIWDLLVRDSFTRFLYSKYFVLYSDLIVLNLVKRSTEKWTADDEKQELKHIMNETELSIDVSAVLDARKDSLSVDLDDPNSFYRADTERIAKETIGYEFMTNSFKTNTAMPQSDQL